MYHEFVTALVPSSREKFGIPDPSLPVTVVMDEHIMAESITNLIPHSRQDLARKFRSEFQVAREGVSRNHRFSHRWLHLGVISRTKAGSKSARVFCWFELFSPFVVASSGVERFFVGVWEAPDSRWPHSHDGRLSGGHDPADFLLEQGACLPCWCLMPLLSQYL